MLTSDLVRATVRDGTLHLTAMKAPARKEAVAIAGEYLAITSAMIGEPLASVREAFAAVETPHRLAKVALGLEKLLLDATEIEAEANLDPVALRQEVFTHATEARRAADRADRFDRDGVLAAIAARHETDVPTVERALFSDLRAAHRILRAPAFDAETLVRTYELAQEQAVLLRAERVVVEVRCSAASVYRALFRRLKFLRLLCTVDAIPNGGYRLTIDGPYSLFASTTKYGLELAMLVPLLRECDSYELSAVVRWGATKDRVVYASLGSIRGGVIDAPSLPEELDALVRTFRAKHDDYEVAPADALIEVRGLGVLVPDLVFTHRETGEVIMLELLGHWSRDAVWKRVEIAERELDTPFVFAVPARLRVSEDVLPDDLPACLYTFKGTLRATAIHERLEQLRSRPRRRSPSGPSKREKPP